MERYLLKKEIGKGSFGTVYRAEKKATSKIFAIKKVRCDAPENVELALQEFWTLSCLQEHLNIIRFEECFLQHAGAVKLMKHGDITSSGYLDLIEMSIKGECNVSVRNGGYHLWFVMEYCDQGDMNEYILSRLPIPSLNTSFMLQLADGMCFLHKNNVVHRDLKPENILVQTELKQANKSDSIPILKIADFGLSKVCLANESTNRVNVNECWLSSACGSDFFMAPEVFEERYTAKADVFALGIIFWAIMDRITFIDASTKKVLLGTYVRQEKKVLSVGEALLDDPKLDILKLLHETSLRQPVSSTNKHKIVRLRRTRNAHSCTCVEGDAVKLRGLVALMVHVNADRRPNSEELLIQLKKVLSTPRKRSSIVNKLMKKTASHKSQPNDITFQKNIVYKESADADSGSRTASNPPQITRPPSLPVTIVRSKRMSALRRHTHKVVENEIIDGPITRDKESNILTKRRSGRLLRRKLNNRGVSNRKKITLEKAEPDLKTAASNHSCSSSLSVDPIKNSVDENGESKMRLFELRKIKVTKQQHLKNFNQTTNQTESNNLSLKRNRDSRGRKSPSNQTQSVTRKKTTQKVDFSFHLKQGNRVKSVTKLINCRNNNISSLVNTLQTKKLSGVKSLNSCDPLPRSLKKHQNKLTKSRCLRSSVNERKKSLRSYIRTFETPILTPKIRRKCKAINSISEITDASPTEDVNQEMHKKESKVAFQPKNDVANSIKDLIIYLPSKLPTTISNLTNTVESIPNTVRVSSATTPLPSSKKDNFSSNKEITVKSTEVSKPSVNGKNGDKYDESSKYDTDQTLPIPVTTAVISDTKMLVTTSDAFRVSSITTPLPSSKKDNLSPNEESVVKSTIISKPSVIKKNTDKFDEPLKCDDELTVPISMTNALISDSKMLIMNSDSGGKETFENEIFSVNVSDRPSSLRESVRPYSPRDQATDLVKEDIVTNSIFTKSSKSSACVFKDSATNNNSKVVDLNNFENPTSIQSFNTTSISSTLVSTNISFLLDSSCSKPSPEQSFSVNVETSRKPVLTSSSFQQLDFTTKNHKSQLRKSNSTNSVEEQQHDQSKQISQTASNMLVGSSENAYNGDSLYLGIKNILNTSPIPVCGDSEYFKPLVSSSLDSTAFVVPTSSNIIKDHLEDTCLLSCDLFSSPSIISKPSSTTIKSCAPSATTAVFPLKHSLSNAFSSSNVCTISSTATSKLFAPYVTTSVVSSQKSISKMLQERSNNVHLSSEHTTYSALTSTDSPAAAGRSISLTGTSVLSVQTAVSTSLIECSTNLCPSSPYTTSFATTNASFSTATTRLYMPSLKTSILPVKTSVGIAFEERNENIAFLSSHTTLSTKADVETISSQERAPFVKNSPIPYQTSTHLDDYSSNVFPSFTAISTTTLVLPSISRGKTDVPLTNTSCSTTKMSWSSRNDYPKEILTFGDGGKIAGSHSISNLHHPLMICKKPKDIYVTQSMPIFDYNFPKPKQSKFAHSSSTSLSKLDLPFNSGGENPSQNTLANSQYSLSRFAVEKSSFNNCANKTNSASVLPPMIGNVTSCILPSTISSPINTVSRNINQAIKDVKISTAHPKLHVNGNNHLSEQTLSKYNICFNDHSRVSPFTDYSSVTYCSKNDCSFNQGSSKPNWTQSHTSPCSKSSTVKHFLSHGCSFESKSHIVDGSVNANSKAANKNHFYSLLNRHMTQDKLRRDKQNLNVMGLQKDSHLIQSPSSRMGQVCLSKTAGLQHGINTPEAQFMNKHSQSNLRSMNNVKAFPSSSNSLLLSSSSDLKRKKDLSISKTSIKPSTELNPFRPYLYCTVSDVPRSISKNNQLHKTAQAGFYPSSSATKSYAMSTNLKQNYGLNQAFPSSSGFIASSETNVLKYLTDPRFTSTTITRTFSSSPSVAQTALYTSNNGQNFSSVGTIKKIQSLNDKISHLNPPLVSDSIDKQLFPNFTIVKNKREPPRNSNKKELLNQAIISKQIRNKMQYNAGHNWQRSSLPESSSHSVHIRGEAEGFTASKFPNISSPESSSIKTNNKFSIDSPIHSNISKPTLFHDQYYNHHYSSDSSITNQSSWSHPYQSMHTIGPSYLNLAKVNCKEDKKLPLASSKLQALTTTQSSYSLSNISLQKEEPLNRSQPLNFSMRDLSIVAPESERAWHRSESSSSLPVDKQKLMNFLTFCDLTSKLPSSKNSNPLQDHIPLLSYSPHVRSPDNYRDVKRKFQTSFPTDTSPISKKMKFDSMSPRKLSYKETCDPLLYSNSPHHYSAGVSQSESYGRNDIINRANVSSNNIKIGHLSIGLPSLVQGLTQPKLQPETHVSKSLVSPSKDRYYSYEGNINKYSKNQSAYSKISTSCQVHFPTLSSHILPHYAQRPLSSGRVEHRANSCDLNSSNIFQTPFSSPSSNLTARP